METFGELARARDQRLKQQVLDDRNHPMVIRSSATDQRKRWNIKGLSVNISVAFISFIILFKPHQVHSLKNRFGTITVISAKPCQNALGQFGTCMFMWDCIKSEGVHLGTCSDRFLFGSCCYHSSPLPLTLPIEGTNQKLNLSSAFSHQNGSLISSIKDDVLQQHSSTTTATFAAPHVLNSASSFKPDRLFLSSHSSASTGSLDYVTTTSSTAPANSSNNEHTKNPSYDMQSNHFENTTRDDLLTSSNKIYVPQTSSQWTMSEPSTAAASMGTTTTSTTTTSTTTTSTTTTPMPSSYQQVSEHNHWQQLQTNYSATESPMVPSMASSSGISGSTFQRPSTTHSDTNQVIAYQSISRPSGLSSQSIISLPNAPPTGSAAAETVSQTPRPASSWLSRPSLLANAIFHSFKPYLSSNRQRPTYRPYIGGGFRPQHQPQRPMLAQQNYHHRPSLFSSTTMSSVIQQPSHTSSLDTINSLQINDGKTSTAVMSSETGPNSLQENSDHHIVNPSTMTDRRRPIDQSSLNHNNFISSAQTSDLLSQTTNANTSSMFNNIYDQTKQQNLAQYEMLNAHETVNNGNGSVKVPTSGLNPNASSISNEYTFGPHTNLTDANLGPDRTSSWSSSLPTLTSTTTPATTLIPQSSLIYEYNNSQHHSYTANNQQHHSSANESEISSSFPIPNSGFLATPSVSDSGSVGEIHGLIDGNSHYDVSSKPLTPTLLPTLPSPQQDSLSHLINSSLLNQLDGYHISSNAQSGYDLVSPNKNSSQTIPNVVQPSETVLIGNIDDLPFSSSPQTNESAPDVPISTAPSSLQTATATATQAQPNNQGCTTTAAPNSNRIQHQHGQHHQMGPLMSNGNKDASCGVTALYPQTKVVGGKNAAFGAWPWQVSVRKVSFFGFSSTHRCGGAVISSEWIATAGHCVEDLALQSIRIRVGEYDFSTMAEPYPHIERGARRKVVHPKYNFYTYENDLALVQLDQPLQFSPHVAPICLPPDNIDLVGRNATVTGWGRLNEGGTLPTILQEVIVPIVSNDKCRDMFLRAGRPEYIPDIFLCAGYEEGGRDSCQGDSGGPLQVRGDDGRWVLAGIISWGIGCAEPLLVGVCSAIQRFKPWIQSTISATS